VVGRLDAARLLTDDAGARTRSRRRTDPTAAPNDPVVRTAARVQKFSGALRADLVRDLTGWEGEITPIWPRRTGLQSRRP